MMDIIYIKLKLYILIYTMIEHNTFECKPNNYDYFQYDLWWDKFSSYSYEQYF